MSSHALKFREMMEPTVEASNTGQLQDDLKKLVDTIKANGKGKPYDSVIWREMSDLQLSLVNASAPNCDNPTDYALPSVAYQKSARYGIKYILSGINLSSESILPKSWGYRNSDAAHVKGIQKCFGIVPLKKYLVMGMFKKFVYYE